jgi:hypothetical protein
VQTAGKRCQSLAGSQRAKSAGLFPWGNFASSASDRLVEAGVLPPERRPGSEYLAWSAVRGLAMLLQAVRWAALSALAVAMDRLRDPR